MKNKTRKFMSTLLLLAMMVTTMVSNVFTVSAASVEDTDMQGWSWEDNDVSKATRVFENGNHMAKLSFTGKNTYFMKYDFSNKIVSGHTYKVSAYIKVDTDATAGYLFFGSNWDCKNSNTSVLNYKAGQVVEFTDTAKKNRVMFGLDSNIVAEMYIDNIVITDITDSANPVVIDCFNTDFEESTTPIVEDTDMQGWSWEDNDVSKATRVFENGNHMAKLSFTGKNTYFMKYDFSNKIVSGHTYKVSAYIKVDTDATAGYLFFGSNWDCKNSDTSVLNYKAGKVVEFTDTKQKNRVMFGLDSNITADMYIDNIVITDITDSANPVIIDCFNTDFESNLTEKIDFTKNNGGEATVAIISKNDTYDIYLAWAIYEVDEDGNKTLDNVSFEKKTITASDDVQSFTITPEIKAGYATKAYLWKADNFAPLAPALEFEAIESAE